MDQELIALTHVCRGWRDAFISRSSLWTQLDFTDVDKTRTYIQRSRSSPLDLDFTVGEVIDDAFALVIPHIRRLRSLVIDQNTALPSALRHFRCHTPLLEKLDIKIVSYRDPVLDGALFNTDISSLRDLRLGGVITHVPWKSLANLQVAYLKSCRHSYETTQMLDFFESAPLLHTVLLSYPMPLTSSDAPQRRIVPLCHLKSFSISASPLPSTLLRHLRIPIGASLISEFHFLGGESPFLDYHPERSPNFDNISHITTINFFFARPKCVRLSGPSGSLRVIAWDSPRSASSSYHTDCQMLHSLGHPMLSKIQKLVISEYRNRKRAKDDGCPIFKTLSTTNDLRTFVLIDSHFLPLILAWDPEQNPLNLILCPSMEELVLYIVQHLDDLLLKCLTTMAKNRASRGAKLSSITIAIRVLCGHPVEKDLSKLRKYVTHVEYREPDSVPPPWDVIPGE